MSDTTTTTTAADTTTTAADNNKAADAPDLAAQIASLTATVASLTKAKDDADAAAETARKAGLTEAQKLAEEREAFQAEVASTRQGLVSEARNATLDKMGVLPAYRAWAPQDADPRTPEGARALEAWAKEHPEVVRVTTAGPAPMTPAPESKLAKVLSGIAASPYISADGLRKLVSGN